MTGIGRRRWVGWSVETREREKRVVGEVCVFFVYKMK